MWINFIELLISTHHVWNTYFTLALIEHVSHNYSETGIMLVFMHEGNIAYARAYGILFGNPRTDL